MSARRALLATWLLAAGCGWLGGEAADAPARPRKAAKAVPAKGVGAPRTVLFVVMDTVRADHTSLCGYERPTTPNLQRLVDRGAAHACRAYSPAPWTHPSHASYFTGKPVTEHAAIWVTESEVAINPVTRVRPLNPAFTTLAEEFRDRGYQTVAVSANMIVTPASGLLQGFDTIEVTPSSLGLRGRKLKLKLREVVAGLDPERPLFLFLNLYDAHDPYPAIPEDAGWVPPQPRLDLHPNDHDESLPYVRYTKGLPLDDEAGFLRQIRDGYDWGVHDADENLGAALKALQDAGWLGDDWRVVVTADHGEALGEHRLLRHGGYLVEPMVKVPFVYYDATAAKQPVLPSPMSAIAAHDLLLTGTLPDVAVVASSEKNERDVLVGKVGAAVWGGDAKVQCLEGVRERIDLAADPGEDHPAPLPAADPLAPTLDRACEALGRLHALPPPKKDDPELLKALEAVGYLQK